VSAVGYAVIATGGKQHKVNVGDQIRVELLEAAVGDKVTFDQVLAVQTRDGLHIGRPTVKGAKVVAQAEFDGSHGGRDQGRLMGSRSR
jgi:large subunit ribosomal protein L21